MVGVGMLQDHPIAFLGLGYDVLRRVGSHLDRRSAQRLALASSQCRIAGEAGIWRNLQLTDRKRFAVCPASEGDEFRLSDPSLERVEALLQQVRDRPWRAGMVRRLQLEIAHGYTHELVELLEAIAGGLVELELRTRSGAANTVPAPAGATYFFSQLRTCLSRLEHLAIDAQPHFGQDVAEILGLAPSLQSLSIHFASVSKQAFMTSRLPRKPVRRRQLKHLRVLGICSLTSPLVASLVCSLPNLRTLELISTTSDAFVDMDLLHTTLQLRFLKHLDIPLRCSPEDFDSPENRQDSLETLTVRGDLHDIHDNIQHLLPYSSTLLQFRLIIRLAASPDPDAHSVSSRFASELLDAMIGQLARTPKLAVIHLKSSEESDAWLPSLTPSPCRPRRGLTIYSWDSPEGHLLLHVRRHMRDRAIGGIPSTSTATPSWSDKAWYRGVEISNAILAATYVASGIDINQTVPGRGQCLPPIGWSILRYHAENAD